ncbi:MAG TPA: tetratricopeptide repeat protein, partial [Kiritimatiellia bacterium]
AQYLFQAGRTDEASAALDHALEFQPGNSQAHWLKGRMFLAAGRNDEAAAELRLAERAEPLPEIQWALADALHAAGREIEAKAVEAKLVAHGATSDPRSFALYLATRGVDTSRAVELARREIELRQDVFTKDALAWALYADGRIDEAARLQAEALAAGTRDARMYGHAAAIFRAAGRTDDGRSAAAEAERLRHMLLPSETQHNQQGG